MDETWTSVRVANPSEVRTIVRQKHRHYNNLFIAGIYTVKKDFANLTQIQSFAGPLRICLEQHPFLNIVIHRDSTGRYNYAKTNSIDLHNHFRLIKLEDIDSKLTDPEDELLVKTFEHICNGLSFARTVEKHPSWCVNVLPLRDDGDYARALIAFTFPHTNGDGMSGIAFHRTFLQAFNDQVKSGKVSKEVNFPSFSGKLASVGNLPVSWSYLLGPALGHYLPKFVADAFGLKPSVTGSDEKTWTATETFENTSESDIRALSCVESCQIEAETLSKVLLTCKQQNTKLTPVLNQLIASAVFKQLSRSKEGLKSFNLISTTPINLRTASGVSEIDMGLFASAVSTRHEQEHIRERFQWEETRGMNGRMWSEAQKASVQTVAASQTLFNQPIGLLRYISDLDKWQAEKIGKSRDSSWELSNVMTFDGSGENVHVQKMFFCQCADIGGSPISFNVVSVEGGVFTICASWQLGALGLDVSESSHGSVRISKGLSVDNHNVQAVEREFVKIILSNLRLDLEIVST